MRMLLATCVFVVVSAAGAAGADKIKTEKLEPSLSSDSRLIIVRAKGRENRQCAAIQVGVFAILTSYHCLEPWWGNTGSYSLAYSTDTTRATSYGTFRQAWRGDQKTAPVWGVLETRGNSDGYFGYAALGRPDPARTFHLVGFSRKIKSGRELAMQRGCHLTYEASDMYSSECGADFDNSGILVLTVTAQEKQLNALAVVESQAKIGKRQVYRLRVASNAQYASRLSALRENQDARYRALGELRREARLLQESPGYQQGGINWRKLLQTILDALDPSSRDSPAVAAIRGALGSGRSPSGQQVQALSNLLSKDTGVDPAVRFLAERMPPSLAAPSAAAAPGSARPYDAPPPRTYGGGQTPPRSIGGGCQETLTHIAGRLPLFADPDLSNLRQTILATRIADVEASIRAQGLPLANAASLIIQQSRAYDDTMRDSKTCAARVFDGSEAALAAALERRQYDAPLATRLGQSTTIRRMVEGSANQNMLGSCLRAYIAADMGKIAGDETAVQVTCRAAGR